MHRRLAILAVIPMLLFVACNDNDTDVADDTTTTTTTRPPAEERLDQTDEQTIERVAQAAQNMVDEGTASFMMELRTEGTGAQRDPEPIEVEGYVDFENEQRQFSYGEGEDGIDVIVDGSTAYIQLPFTEDDDWASIELDVLLDAEVGVGGPAAIPYQNPGDNIRVLQGTVTDTREVGTETVRGDSTTHYHLTIDLRAAATEADDDAQEALRRTTEQTGLEELEMAVWIDDDDLIRRVEYTVDLEQAEITEEDEAGTVEADPQFRTIVTIEYFDIGDPVDIELPDEENVVVLDEERIRDAVRDLDPEQDGGTGTTTTTN
jgi:hypothetical protein